MARKRQEGITTNPRYKMKAYAVGMGITGGHKEYSEDYAEALTIARAAGAGVFTSAYQEIKPVLMKEEVPSALWGLYRAFVCEYIAKVQKRKIAKADDIFNKWEILGLDGHILRLCIESIGEVTSDAPPTPASKGA